MFKKTSDNTQHRERAKAEHSRTNTGGIDPTAFITTDELLQQRVRLVTRKQEIERAQGKIKSQFSEAGRRLHTEGKSMPPGVISRWKKEQERLREEKQAIEAELQAIKAATLQKINQQEEEKWKDYNYVFRVMAKDMLAGEVYQRIEIAALHRMGISKDD